MLKWLKTLLKPKPRGIKYIFPEAEYVVYFMNKNGLHGIDGNGNVRPVSKPVDTSGWKIINVEHTNQ